MYKKTIILGAIITLSVSSCRKETEVDRDTSTASDNSTAEMIFNEVKNITDAAAGGTLSNTGYRSAWDTISTGCATIIHDTTTNPRTLSIDYGSTNCLCADGKNRRGKIMVSYTGPYRQAGTVITHTFNNYYVNDNQVLGTKTVTNMGTNTAGNLYYNIDVNGQINKASGGTISWTSQRVREWIQGSSTMNILDDIYLITGSGSGTSANGNSFTVQITNPLRVELICPRIVSGTIVVTPSNKPARTLDYGSGACDANATVTINGNTYPITLW